MLFNFQGPFAVPTAGLYYITLLRSCQHFFQNFFQAARPKSLFCFFSAALTRQPWYHITPSCICQHFFWKLLSGRQARPPFPFVVLSLAKQLSYNTTPLPLCQLFLQKNCAKLTFLSFLPLYRERYLLYINYIASSVGFCYRNGREIQISLLLFFKTVVY